jgi:hypothetical protein
MNTLSVSSYSIREQLGPVVFDFVEDGTVGPVPHHQDRRNLT